MYIAGEMGNCLGVNKVSDTPIIVPAVKTKKDYELTDAFNKRISSHPDFLAFVASHKLDSYHQHQWKCKMQMMMTGQSKSIVGSTTRVQGWICALIPAQGYVSMWVATCVGFLAGRLETGAIAWGSTTGILFQSGSDSPLR